MRWCGRPCRARPCGRSGEIRRRSNCAIRNEPARFTDAGARDLRLEPGSPAAGFGASTFLDPADAALRVDRDFNGGPRPARPAAGAFEPGT